jgi:hypothetical protein
LINLLERLEKQKGDLPMQTARIVAESVARTFTPG